MIDYNKINWYKVKRSQEIKKGYDQTVYTFDIETSSGFIPPGAMVAQPFDYSKNPAYYRECTKVALCYLWQFGIGDEYYFGRELKDFMRVLDALDALPGKKIVWVHNLSFEQVFLLNLFFPEKIFARKAHKVIYFEYGSITFRCSYMLTNLSLANWAKSTGAPPKLEGFDYEKIRTPLSPLTPFEMAYGQRDLEIIKFGIDKMLDQYDLIQKIPLTQTGRVRKEVNDIFANDVRYRYKMARLLPKDAQEYIRWRMCFSGGNTHANWYYAGILVRGVSEVDIASSYPYECCSSLLPMGTFRRAHNPEKMLANPKYLCICEVEFTDLQATMHIDYISYSKIYDIRMVPDPDRPGKQKEDLIVENGKVHFIGQCKMMLTEFDLDVIRQAYSGGIKILRCWYSRAGRLDKRYVNFILDLYENKTKLKGVKGSEDLYVYSKQLINGIYGDFVSAISYDDTVLHEDGSWEEVEKSLQDVNDRINYLREKPWRLKSSYIWGVFITAAARRDHFRMLKMLDKENHVVYYDTDSVYYIGHHEKDIAAYNKEATERIDKALQELGIDPERSRPKDKNGIPHQMGIMEQEQKDLPEFKALRAKCYAYRDHDGGLHTTISGVSKAKGSNALKGSLDNFHNDLVFSYQECGKSISTYNRNQPPCIWIGEDGKAYGSDYKFGLNLMPTQYHLSIGQDFYDTLALIGSLSCKLSEVSIDELAEIERGML